MRRAIVSILLFLAALWNALVTAACGPEDTRADAAAYEAAEKVQSTATHGRILFTPSIGQ